MTDLQAYKDRYDQQAKVALHTKEAEIEELHNEIESISNSHRDLIKQINGEKELLISQNSDLKK